MPSPLSVKVTPAGNAPCADSAAVGKPLLVSVKVAAWPVVNVTSAALVMRGGSSTVNLKSCLAAVEMPLPAVIVNG